VSVAGESVLLVLVVHLEREGVLDVVGLDRVPTVVAQLVRRREALADGKSSIVTHVHGENNLEKIKKSNRLFNFFNWIQIYLNLIKSSFNDISKILKIQLKSLEFTQFTQM
jgi:hypothetical protein